MQFDDWWKLSEGKTSADREVAKDAWDAATKLSERRIVEVLDLAVAMTHGKTVVK